MQKEYLIFQLKRDKRFKKGYNPASFKYIDKAGDHETAKQKAEAKKNPAYIIGIETITTY